MPKTLKFTPVTEHPRFVEGDAENQKTLRKFAEGLIELQAQNPEIAGATLFGSRLKGKATAESDIDSTILINADQLEARGVQFGITPENKITWGRHSELETDFKSHFGDMLAAKTSKDPSTIKEGLYIVPISQKLIEKQIHSHVNYLRAYDDYKAKSQTWFNDLDASDEARPEPPEYVPLTGGIPALFSPDLTPGLDRYRADVIEALTCAEEYGDHAWKDIMSYVGFGEGHYELDDSTKYPTNLQEAREWYV